MKTLFNFTQFKELLTAKYFAVMVLLSFLFLSSFQAMAVIRTSNGSNTSWNNAGSWTPNGIPANGDAVTIAAGHSIIVDIDTKNLLSLTISGTLTVGNSNINRVVTVSGDVLITSTGTFKTVGNGGNQLLVSGNLTNNGTLDCKISAAEMDVTFKGGANQTINGTGGTTDFNLIIVNNTGTAGNNIVEVSSTNFTAVAAFLILTKGVLKMSGLYSLTNDFLAGPGYSIDAGAGLWLNNPNVTVSGQGGTVILAGSLQIDQGNYKVGTSAGNSLNATLATSALRIGGGTLKVAGRLTCTGGTYTQTNGVVTVCTVANGAMAKPSFNFTGATFTMSNGTIILEQAADIANDFVNYGTTVNITGGLLQIGNAATTGLYIFFVAGKLPSMTIDATSNPKTVWAVDNISIKGNLNINTNSELYCYDPSLNGYTVSLDGNVVNNGYIDGYDLSEFEFRGTSAQAYSGSGTFGTTSIPFEGWGISVYNPANVTFSSTNPLYTTRVNLFTGTAINSNRITLGSGGSSAATIQRGAYTGINAGAFDVSPTFNVGTGGLYLLYDIANAVTTGFEVPASRNVFYLDNSNTSGLTLAGGNLTVADEIQLNSGTFDIGANNLILTKTITRVSGNINGSAGTVELNGPTAAQTIPANTFQSNNLKDLIISNGNTNSGVKLGGSLDIYGSLSFTGSNKKLTTADYLTLKSTPTSNAFIAEIPVDVAGVALDSIKGNVTVERYIPAHKAWRFLSVPTTGQTIRDAWQEGHGNNDGLPAGFGIQITGNSIANGFDVATSTPSMKSYITGTGLYQPVTSTLNPFSPNTPYMIFIRGDRGANTIASTANNTVLRTKGTLFTGTQPAVSVGMNKFAAVNNSYAASIDFRNVNRSNVDAKYYVYDPKLGLLGGFQTFLRNNVTGNYEVAVSGGSYTSADGIYNHIQSGEGFFVFSSTVGGGTVGLEENDKSNNFLSVFKPAGVNSADRKLKTRLFLIQDDGSRLMLDGTLNRYDNLYNNAVDADDAKKVINFGENLSLKNDNALLVVESRHSLVNSDTVFYHLTGVGIKKYQFEFTANDLSQPGLAAFLEDRFLNTKTFVDLNNTTLINFTVVNAAGSYAVDRFRLVFQKLSPVPLTITHIGAIRNQDKSIAINWKVENETSIEGYTIERSSNGTDFTGILTAAAKSNNGAAISYKDNDLSPLATANFYRIKAMTTGGSPEYSDIVKVLPLKQAPGITIYPNPVLNRTLQLQFSRQTVGDYNIQLISNLGQTLYNSNIKIDNGDMQKSIQLDKEITTGSYQILIISANGTRVTLPVLIQ